MPRKRQAKGHRSLNSIREEWAPGHIARLEKKVQELTEERDALKLKLEKLKALADRMSSTQ
jgi:hypothetical protein